MYFMANKFVVDFVWEINKFIEYTAKSIFEVKKKTYNIKNSKSLNHTPIEFLTLTGNWAFLRL